MNNRIGARSNAGASKVLQAAFLRSCMALFILCLNGGATGQMGTPTPLPPAERQKAEAESKATGALANYPRLVDITDSTGIHFEHLSSPEAKFIAESMSGGVALIDYDGDGWLDIYFTNAQSVEMALHGAKARSALFHNNHDGTFTDVTDKAGVGYPCWAMGAVVGDYNNDGRPDLLVTCLGGVVLYRNNGDGTFTDVSKKSGVDDPEHRYGLTAIWSDFDNDGKLDLFVTNDGQANYLHQGDGTGKFADVALTSGVAANEDGLEQANMGVALGDYLHTGRMSLLLSHFDNEYAALYRNDGGMNFADMSIASGIARGTQGYVGWGDAFVDFDNDGWEDFFLVNGHVYPQVDNAHTAARYLEPKLLFINQRDGTFKNASRLAGGAIQIGQVSRGLAVGDLFNDGKLEAVVENLVGKPMVLRPEGGPQNHWVSFQLEGVKSARLALNARVRATAGDLVQVGEVLSGGSYLSQHDLRIHLGLGKHERLDQAEVLWPDGKRETLTNLAADRFYVVREGNGVVSSKLPEHRVKLP